MVGGKGPLPREYVDAYKLGWIKAYAEVINDAAEQYNVPSFAIAQVAFGEVAGAPPILDDAAYMGRNVLHQSEADTNLYNRDPIFTSFGDLSMQLIRAAETVGYEDARNLSVDQINYLIDSLKDPEQMIYFAAKHLSDLRLTDFSDISPECMSEEQWSVTVERYNRGLNPSYDELKNNHGYADGWLKYKSQIIEYLDLK